MYIYDGNESHAYVTLRASVLSGRIISSSLGGVLCVINIDDIDEWEGETIGARGAGFSALHIYLQSRYHFI